MSEESKRAVLSAFSDQELRKELNLRRLPGIKISENDEQLRVLRARCIEFAINNIVDESDYKQYIFEAAMEVVFGPGIWAALQGKE